jgi:hypothetical protein
MDNICKLSSCIHVFSLIGVKGFSFGLLHQAIFQLTYAFMRYHTTTDNNKITNQDLCKLIQRLV